MIAKPPAAVVAPFDYTADLGLAGWTLWREALWVGAAIVAAAGVYHAPRNGARPQCARDGPREALIGRYGVLHH